MTYQQSLKSRETFFFSSHDWPNQRDPFDLDKATAKLTEVDVNECRRCGTRRVDGQNTYCQWAEKPIEGLRFVEDFRGHHILTLIDEESYPAACTKCGLPRPMALKTPCSGNLSEQLDPVNIAIHVIYHNDHSDKIPVPHGQGWKIDACRRLLIVGKGVGRVMVPLENIRHFGPVKN